MWTSSAEARAAQANLESTEETRGHEFAPEPVADTNLVIHAADLPDYRHGYRVDYHDGEKFAGGFGPNVYLWIDYWALRTKSVELFNRNLYARGIIRRYVTNIINTGLALESCPAEKTLGREEGSLNEWTDEVEERFELWASDPIFCDQAQRQTFGDLQRQAELQALVCGDVLVVQRFDRVTGLPRLQLIDGSKVQTPVDGALDSNIRHGVELDDSGRQVAYWVTQEDGTSKRLPAWSARTGRRIAWLYYGTENLLDEVRGQPLLALVLTSLKEIDRYRESAQRKAIITSKIAAFVTQEGEQMGTRPWAAGAVRAGTVTTTDATGNKTSLRAEEFIPGYVVDRLAPGEKINFGNATGTDEKFGDFERSIVAAIGWALEMPPEILTLAFSANYSASQAAINEYKMFLDPKRLRFGQQVCQPIYSTWLIAEVNAGRIDAPGLLEAWRGRTAEDRYRLGAWLFSEWSGHVKPTTDLAKMTKGYIEQLNNGLITYRKAARELNGSKFESNIRIQKRERELALAAGVPMGDAPATNTTGEEPPGNEEESDDERSVAD